MQVWSTGTVVVVVEVVVVVIGSAGIDVVVVGVGAGAAVVGGLSDHAPVDGIITVIGVSIASQDAPNTAETDTRRTIVAARFLLVFANLMPSIWQKIARTQLGKNLIRTSLGQIGESLILIRILPVFAPVNMALRASTEASKPSK